MADERSLVKCIFFSEFDPVAGPRIAFQYPKDYISKEDFDAIHDYIITKPSLAGKTITINVVDHTILGCPVVIEGAKYARNALIFNLCLVFKRNFHALKYETIVKKVSIYLTNLEIHTHFLSTDETKASLPAMLQQILTDLNSKGVCKLHANAFTTLHLKIIPPTHEPVCIEEYMVPLHNLDAPNFSQFCCHDLVTKQIISYIDGYRHVVKIAALADVDINIVKACLQNLVYYGVICMIPIFQYSNIYVTNASITNLVTNSNLQKDCLDYVKAGKESPRFQDVMLLFSSLRAGTTVRDVCTRFNPHTLHIDERKLIQFGLLNKFVRRLHKFPVRLSNINTGSQLYGLYRWFNGSHNLDEISAKSGVEIKIIDNEIENDPNVAVLWK